MFKKEIKQVPKFDRLNMTASNASFSINNRLLKNM